MHTYTYIYIYVIYWFYSVLIDFQKQKKMLLAMDGPCGCRARGVQEMIDCIRGGRQFSDDFRGRPILYLETRKKKFGNCQGPRIFASWGGNTDERVSILCN